MSGHPTRSALVPVPLERSGRTEAVMVAGIISVTVILGLAWIHLLDAAGFAPPRWLSLCLLREVTGIPCPFCGGTRALVALSKGSPGDALAWNPVVALAAMTAITSPLALLVAGSGRAVEVMRRLARPSILWPLVLVNWACVAIHLAHSG